MCIVSTLKKRERERREHSLNKKMENYLRSLLPLRVRKEGGRLWRMGFEESAINDYSNQLLETFIFRLYVCERVSERDKCQLEIKLMGESFDGIEFGMNE
jgi:hypothetical protein